MDNKAQGESMEWLVNLIVIIAVIIVVGGGIFLFLKYEGWKILPGFGDEENDEDTNGVIIDDDFDIKLENPWKVRYLITGRDAENIYYNCNEAEGWRWYHEKIKNWWKVSSTEHAVFKEFSVKNQEFIKSLQGLNCEEGLALIVDRVEKNDEGKSWGFKSSVGLKILTEKDSRTYQSGDEIFKDVRFLIKKINMMSE